MNFRLCDINLFIEHKKNSCTNYTTESRSPADNFVANLLECVQCFRKFPTPWPLLLHVQSEHQLLFVNTTQPPSDASIRDVNGSMCLTQKPADQSGSTDVHKLLDHSMDEAPKHELASVGTQTILSSFKKILPVSKKRGVTSSGISTSTRRNCAAEVVDGQPCACANTNDTLCYCTSTSCRLPTSLYCGCGHCCSSSYSLYPKHGRCDALLRHTSCALQASPSTSSISAPGSVTSHNDGTDTSSSSGQCCMSLVRCNTRCCLSDSTTVTTSQSLTVSCCPCPPVIRKPNTTSSEVQTDLEPEFGELNYSDIAMLLASPTESVEMSPPAVLDSVLKPDPPARTLTNEVADKEEQASLSSDLVAIEPTVFKFDNSTNASKVTGDSITEQSAPSTSFSLVTPACQENTAPVITFDILTESDQPEGIFSESNSQSLVSLVGSSSQQHSIVSQRENQRSLLPTTARFMCTQCGKVHQQKIHLKKHIMTQHIRKKPYGCPLCNYTTVEKSHLTVHIRTHTGERPFRCRVCEYSSTQNCTLKSHYIRKHPENRLRCSRCLEAFYTELELGKHQRMCFFGLL